MSLPGFFGKKLGMTQVFSEKGVAIPVTAVQLYPLVVTQVKTPEKDGYSAIQVGFKDAKAKHLTKPEQGHFEKNSIALKRFVKEIRVTPEVLAQFKVGDAIEVTEGLVEDMIIDVTAKSIGKGFQGTIRRWGHHRGPMSHGSKSHRLPGSIGAGTTPGRVQKGLQMAGKTGNERVTTLKLKLVKVLPEKQVVLIRGSVPGAENGLVFIRPTVKSKKVSAS